jgi:hypothetical protein
MREFTYTDAFEIKGRGFAYILKSVGEPLTEATRLHVGDEILLHDFVFRVTGCEGYCTNPMTYIVGPNKDMQSCLLEFVAPIPSS